MIRSISKIVTDYRIGYIGATGMLWWKQEERWPVYAQYSEKIEDDDEGRGCSTEWVRCCEKRVAVASSLDLAMEEVEKLTINIGRTL